LRERRSKGRREGKGECRKRSKVGKVRSRDVRVKGEKGWGREG